MKQLSVLLCLSLIFCACSKKTPMDEANLNWLETKKTSMNNCFCLVELRQGVFEGQTVIEERVIDPLCNGINVVYQLDGTVLLYSHQKEAYELYLNQVKNLSVIWTCEKKKKE